ncbi:MAG: DMT family transporter [Deltaproteobacteria bacterium]
MRDSPLLPWILLTGIAFGWGLNWEILKTGVEEIPPWVFRGASSLPAGLILLVIAKLGKQSLRIERRDWMALFVASLLNMMLWGVLILYGLTQMTGGRAAVLAFTMPVWAALSDSLFSRNSHPDGFLWLCLSEPGECFCCGLEILKPGHLAYGGH